MNNWFEIYDIDSEEVWTRWDENTLESPTEIVARLNLWRVSVTDPEVKRALQETINDNPKAVEDGAIKYLMGILMKKTRGRVDPLELENELRCWLSCQT